MIENIYKLFLDELTLANNNSLFAHQQTKNISNCGNLVEMAFRKFLSEIIGERFKITHGYIFSSVNNKISPQIDIIITDKLVPHTLKKFEYLNGLEIVPAEAVVGILEVKRTLTKDIVESAENHLKKIMDFVPLNKDHKQQYLPGGMILATKGTTVSFTGGKYANPLIGIISLGIEKDMKERTDIVNRTPNWFIDVVFSAEGLLKVPKDSITNAITILPCRNEVLKFEYLTIYDLVNNEKNLKLFVAYLIKYLNAVSGREFEINDYFANKPL